MLTPTPSQIDLWCKCNTLCAELKVRYGVEYKLPNIGESMVANYYVLLNIIEAYKGVANAMREFDDLGIIFYDTTIRQYEFKQPNNHERQDNQLRNRSTRKH